MKKLKDLIFLFLMLILSVSSNFLFNINKINAANNEDALGYPRSDPYSANIANWILGIVSMVSFSGVIYGLLKYFMSKGDIKKAKAKKIFFYSLTIFVITLFIYFLTIIICSVGPGC